MDKAKAETTTVDDDNASWAEGMTVVLGTADAATENSSQQSRSMAGRLQARLLLWRRRRRPGDKEQEQRGAKRRSPEKEAKTKCRPKAAAAVAAIAKAVRSLEQVSTEVAAAAGDTVAAAEADVVETETPTGHWESLLTNMTNSHATALVAQTAARAAQTATMCACLVLDIASSVLDDAVASPLLGDAAPTRATATTMMATTTDIIGRRVQAALDALAAARATLKYPRLSSVCMLSQQRTFEKTLPHLRSLEENLRCARDNAEALHGAIPSGQWWQGGPDSSLASAKVVVRVVKEITRARTCVELASFSVSDAEDLRRRVACYVALDERGRRRLLSDLRFGMRTETTAAGRQPGLGDLTTASMDRMNAVGASAVAEAQAVSTKVLVVTM